MDVDECNGKGSADFSARRREAEERIEASEKGVSTNRSSLATKRPAAADVAVAIDTSRTTDTTSSLKGGAQAAESKVASSEAPTETSSTVLLHSKNKPAEEGDHRKQKNVQGDAATERSDDHSENNGEHSDNEEESISTSVSFSDDDDDSIDPKAVLQRNDPQVWILLLGLRHFDSNRQVVQTARAFHDNQHVREVRLSLYDEDFDFDLNWDPFLNELAAREKLETVDILHTPTGRLLPLFRHQLFQALQRNANVQSLKLRGIHFSNNNNAEAIVTFLDNAQTLTELSLFRCGGADNSSGEGATMFAAALQRNITIQTLNFDEVRHDFVRHIFGSLSSSESKSCLKKISFKPLIISLVPLGAVAEAMQQYLDSPNSTLQCLDLRHLVFDGRSTEVFNLFQGLARSASVKELIFNHCWIVGSSEVAKWHLTNLVRMKPNLSTLRVVRCNDHSNQVHPGLTRLTLFECSQFVDAVTEVLRRPDSPLRCLEVDMTGEYTSDTLQSFFDVRNPPVDNLVALLPAVAGSARLERFVVGNHHSNDTVSENYQTLLENIPLFLAKSFAMTMRERSSEAEEERLLVALRRNYSFQSVEVECQLSTGNPNWFSDANQSRLEFYLDRNRKVALWTEDPGRVPRELWSYALALALEAGFNSLYQSLLALSGQGIGLKHQKRKRKRLQCDGDPSS